MSLLRRTWARVGASNATPIARPGFYPGWRPPLLASMAYTPFVLWILLRLPIPHYVGEAFLSNHTLCLCMYLLDEDLAIQLNNSSTFFRPCMLEREKLFFCVHKGFLKFCLQHCVAVTNQVYSVSLYCNSRINSWATSTPAFP